MKICTLLSGVVFLAGAAMAQQSPLVTGSQAIYNSGKNNILKAADQVSEQLWSWRPTPEVRTFGELFAHIADGQYEFCSPVVDGKAVDKGIEKSKKSKVEVTAALKEAFAYCDSGYKKITAANAAETVELFGRPMARISVMDYNASHNSEHYGNLVTYLRLNKMVPPSSQPSK
ncbi:MAG TPA: DinB family protein [Bryobacteraceae bacterium]|nr:DinB family protein [Bryobacteraceae bacterium]